MRIKQSITQKRISKIILLVFVLLTILIINTLTVSALGITPSKRIVDYDTEEHIFTSKIINNERKDLKLNIAALGELSQYVYISQPTIIIGTKEAEKQFDYVLMLPEGLSPGPKIITIQISEVSLNDEGSITGQLALSQQIQINVPYYGIYANGYLSIYSSEANEPISTLCEVFNLGDQTIEKISGTLLVVDSNKTIYTSDIYNFTLVKPKESVRIDESFILNYVGVYNIECNINYNNENITISKEFMVGEPNLTIISKDISNFKLGTIAKFDIDVVSNWNREIQNVYGILTFQDLNGTIVAQTKIPVSTLNKTSSINVYMDTSNLLVGKYTMAINLYSGTIMFHKEYMTTVNSNSIGLIDDYQSNRLKKFEPLFACLSILLTILLIIVSITLIKKNKKLYK